MPLTRAEIDEALKDIRDDLENHINCVRATPEAQNMASEELEHLFDELRLKQAEKIIRDKKTGNKKLTFIEIKRLVDVFKQSLPQDYEGRRGNCFIYSLRFVTENNIALGNNDCRLVHGYITERGDKLQHAWVQIDKFRYDPVIGDFEAVAALDKKHKRKSVYRYSQAEAVSYHSNDKVYGPWQSLPEAIDCSITEPFLRR